MKKFVNKALHIVLIFAIILTSLGLTSCNRKYDEEEVKGALSELLTKIGVLNTVYFGSGIAYVSSSFSDGVYSEANFLHLKELGFSNIAELKKMTAEVFTDKYSSELFSTKLEDMGDGEYLIQRARYYQKVDFDGSNICIMVDTTATSIFDDRMTFDLDSIRVEGSKRQQVICYVTAEVKSSDEEVQRKELKVILLEEDDGWRIDNPVFANYTED